MVPTELYVVAAGTTVQRTYVWQTATTTAPLTRTTTTVFESQHGSLVEILGVHGYRVGDDTVQATVLRA